VLHPKKHLQDKFYGVKDVRITKHIDGNHPFGFIDFDSEYSLRLALTFHHEEFMGRMLAIYVAYETFQPEQNKIYHFNRNFCPRVAPPSYITSSNPPAQVKHNRVRENPYGNASLDHKKMDEISKERQRKCEEREILNKNNNRKW